MNVFHRYLCASTGWRRRVSATILPWVLDGVDLGSEVLEIGSGYGAAPDGLRACVGHLTCAEIDGALATRLAGHMAGQNVTVLCEDATRMSLPDGACDGAVSMTMLHHVPSAAMQDRLLAEVALVLRPGGIFVGFDAVARPLFRLLHVFDTMVVIDPGTFPQRLARAGFTDIAIDVRARGFRFRARRGHGHGRSPHRGTEPT